MENLIYFLKINIATLLTSLSMMIAPIDVPNQKKTDVAENVQTIVSPASSSIQNIRATSSSAIFSKPIKNKEVVDNKSFLSGTENKITRPNIIIKNKEQLILEQLDKGNTNLIDIYSKVNNVNSGVKIEISDIQETLKKIGGITGSNQTQATDNTYKPPANSQIVPSPQVANSHEQELIKQQILQNQILSEQLRIQSEQANIKRQETADYQYCYSGYAGQGGGASVSAIEIKIARCMRNKGYLNY